MNTGDLAFRKNFIIALVLHATLIGGIVCWEEFLPHGPDNTAASVELITPADILGDLPAGPGHGRGAYAPPKEPAGAEPAAGASDAAVPEDETPAPQPKTAPVAREAAAHDPDEIAISKKKTVEAQKKAAAKAAEAAKANTVAKQKLTAEAKAAAKAKKAGTPGASPTETAAQIRQRFAKALQAAGDGTDGTPYGDGKTAGGGSGKSNRIGSPDGSPDGIPGGVGQGSPFWQYYQGVHDLMYEAWEQPGSVIDRKLVATVMVRIARDGSIASVELQRSSGNRLMDDSALAAARKVEHLEPPPDGLLKGSTANITVDFQVEG